MGRLAEGTSKLAAEVGSRQAGRTREVIDGERLEVPGIREVLGVKEVTCRWREGHRRIIEQPDWDRATA